MENKRDVVTTYKSVATAETAALKKEINNLHILIWKIFYPQSQEIISG